MYEFFDVIFSHKKHEYDDVYSYYFHNKDGVMFEPGQYTHIRFEDLPKEEGKREFSFASTPDEEHIQFTVHVNSGTMFKKRMDAMQERDTAKLYKIKSHIALPESSDAPLIFLAGGVGMTPFRSMIMTAGVRGGYSMKLLQVQRSGKFLFEDDLKEKLVEHVKSSPEDLEKNVQDMAVKNAKALFFVCGSDRFVTGAKAYLESAGISNERVLIENFK